MAHSANKNSNSSNSIDDFDFNEFPEIDKAYLASIWEENQNEQYLNPERLASLIQSLEGDNSVDGLDSHTKIESASSSSSSSVTGLVVDDRNSLSVDDYIIEIGSVSFPTSDEIKNRTDDRKAGDLRNSTAEAVKVEHGGDSSEKVDLEKGRDI